MNRALFYLWFALLKRRLLRSAASLRRPTSFIGFVAVAALLGFIFHYRHEEIFAQMVRRESLIGLGILMIFGSIFAGLRQRGLVFEPPDLEFLFTGPFTRAQIIVYRLLPGYLHALIQSVLCLAIFISHLKHPILAAVCLTFFQIACFHISSACAIWSGNLAGDLYHRLRWMLVGLFAFQTAFYFHVAWDFKFVPAFANAAAARLFFYPAVSLPDLDLPHLASWWKLELFRSQAHFTQDFVHAALWLAAFAGLSAATLWLLLKLKGDIFEASLATSTRAAERRRRLRQGQGFDVGRDAADSVRLPTLPLFQGVGAIIWKNLVVALRSRRELAIAGAATLVYTGFLVALRWALHRVMDGGDVLPPSEVRAFDASLVSLLFFLSFFLQRTLPFDFRRDASHLVGFRTLPVGALALTLAELAVPTAFCIAFQTVGMVILLAFARFEWYLVLLLLLVYPAVSFTLTAVWNLHYLLAATKRAGGNAESASPAREVMVVALSFCMFLPAVWSGQFVGEHLSGKIAVPVGFGTGAAVQYAVDLVLLLALARMFQRFEVSREFQ